MMSRLNLHAQVMHNKKVHDDAAADYEKRHVEIFNPTEQGRIAYALREAMAERATSTHVPRILDFGAGTGNLTAHLLSLSASVVASDVSERSLAELRAKHPKQDRLETAEINGIDLSKFSDETFDMVATYSVLHHVPDYLAAVREFVRVAKPGGIIYIDHEVAPEFWARMDDEYAKYQEAIQKAYGRSRVDRVLRKFGNLLSLAAWKRLLDRKLLGLNEEGDVHVTEEDHIEWPLIEGTLLTGCEVVSCRDFLVCRELSAERPVHRQFENRCVDMRVLVARKRMA